MTNFIHKENQILSDEKTLNNIWELHANMQLKQVQMSHIWQRFTLCIRGFPSKHYIIC